MEPLNGHDVPVAADQVGMTIEEVRALTIGNLVDELKSSGEEILILESTTAAISKGPPVKIRLMVSLNEQGDKYFNAVLARMRKEAERRHRRETSRKLS